VICNDEYEYEYDKRVKLPNSFLIIPNTEHHKLNFDEETLYLINEARDNTKSNQMLNKYRYDGKITFEYVKQSISAYVQSLSQQDFEDNKMFNKLIDRNGTLKYTDLDKKRAEKNPNIDASNFIYY